MNAWRVALTASAAIAAASCASAPQAPVEVMGPVGQLSALEGSWVGEYASAGSGRAGTILFDLVVAEGSAHGEVWMMPGEQGRTLPYEARRPEGIELLTIRFVLVSEGVVSGALDPYLDPATGARLRTSFVGRLDGSVITGTFVTANEVTGATLTGLWSAERKRAQVREDER